MSYSRLTIAPIPVWADTPSGPTAVRLADYSYTWCDRTNSVKRRRPKGIDLLRSATAASTDAQLRMDAPLTYVSGANTIHSSVCSEVGYVGYGGETLPYRKDIVRNKLMARARDSAVNLANTLGEYRQCANMFASACKSFSGLIGVLHSRNPWVIKRYLFSGSTTGFGKIVSKRILEFQYGVKPLISDINGSILALKKRSLEKPIFIRVSAKTTDEYKSILQRRDPVPPYWWNGEALRTEFVRTTKGWAIVTLNRDVLNRSLGQFGFTNPLALAWELTAFSFVLDWFFNVGEFLASLDNCLYFEDSTCQISTSDKYLRVGNVAGVEAVYQRITKVRDNPSGLGSVATLHFKPDFSSTHITNGLALITQTLANIKKR